MTTTEYLSEEELSQAIAAAWAEGRQVDVTLTSHEVLRGTALIPRHAPRQVALFGLKRPGAAGGDRCPAHRGDRGDDRGRPARGRDARSPAERG